MNFKIIVIKIMSVKIRDNTICYKLLVLLEVASQKTSKVSERRRLPNSSTLIYKLLGYKLAVA